MQTDPTLLRYVPAITEQKKCWELLAEKFDRFKLCATTSNNMQQGVQTDATCNIQQCWSCWPTMLRPFARGLIRTLNSLLLKAGAHLMGSCSRGLRPGLKVCSEHMNDWQYLSLGDLEQDEFFVWINKLAFQKEDKHT